MGSPDPEQSSDPPIDERMRRLVVYEIAEEAKQQVTSWAKWIVGAAVLFLGVLGVTTWIDVNSRINEATEAALTDAKKRADEALTQFSTEQEKALTEFQQKANGRLDQLEDLAEQAKRDIEAKTTEVLLTLDPLPVDQQIGSVKPRKVNSRDRVRPIGPGVSIGPPKGTASTLCCIVRDSSGNDYLLSAFVFGNQQIGTHILQPGSIDGGQSTDTVARISEWALEKGALIARIDPGVEHYADVPDVGRIAGVSSLVAKGTTLRKYGRTSGLTSCTVKDANFRFRLSLLTSHEPIRYEGILCSKFSEGGDAGAPVLDKENRLVGIVFAGRPETSIVLPIGPILDTFDVTLVTD